MLASISHVASHSSLLTSSPVQSNNAKAKHSPINGLQIHSTQGHINGQPGSFSSKHARQLLIHSDSEEKLTYPEQLASKH